MHTLIQRHYVGGDGDLSGLERGVNAMHHIEDFSHGRIVPGLKLTLPPGKLSEAGKYRLPAVLAQMPEDSLLIQDSEDRGSGTSLRQAPFHQRVNNP